MAQRSPTRDEKPQPDMPPLLGRGPGGPGQRFSGEVVRAKNTRGTLWRIWGYLRRQRAALIATAVMVVVSSGLTVLGPYLMGLAIDTYIDRGDLPGLARLLLLMLAIYVLTSLLLWAQSYIMAGAAQRTVRDIRNDLFGRLQVLPLRFFDRRPHGELMSRLTNDVENINQVLADSVAQLVSGVLTAVGVAVVMFVINPWLAVISLVSHLGHDAGAQSLDRATHAHRFSAAASGSGHAQRPDRRNGHRTAYRKGVPSRGGGDRAVRHNAIASCARPRRGRRFSPATSAR